MAIIVIFLHLTMSLLKLPLVLKSKESLVTWVDNLLLVNLALN